MADTYELRLVLHENGELDVWELSKGESLTEWCGRTKNGFLIATRRGALCAESDGRVAQAETLVDLQLKMRAMADVGWDDFASPTIVEPRPAG